MGNYITTSDINSYLGEDLSTDTTPTLTQVETYITRAESEIDEVTGTSWTTKTVTGELYDYDEYSVFVKNPTLAKVGRIDTFFTPINNQFKLNNSPIITVTSLEVNVGTATSPSWKTLTEGTEFIVYKDEGVITFISSEGLPVEKYQSIRISYTYGHSTVSELVKKLATLLVVREVMRSKQTEATFVSADSISIETISISKSSRDSVELLGSLDKEIEKLFERVGNINQWVV